MSMFSFWSRRGNKSPAEGRTSNVLPQMPRSGLEVDIPRTSSETPHPQSLPPHKEPPHVSNAQTQVTSEPEPVVVAVPNPHDVALSEVHAKLVQAERLSSTARPSRSSGDPLTDSAKSPNPPPEPLFDPATGAQRGFFESIPPNGSGDSEQLRDEMWSHLAHIRELQSEIAAMHMQMEGIGDENGSMDVEVDVDIDVDTVATQEEEEAAKREKEFKKLPGRFKGRSDNIDVMMAKLDDLSRAVTSFHALQPPPLSFDSVSTSRQNTHPDIPGPSGEQVIPFIARTRPTAPSTAMFGARVGPDQTQTAEILHDSPVSTHASLPTDVPIPT